MANSDANCCGCGVEKLDEFFIRNKSNSLKLQSFFIKKSHFTQPSARFNRKTFRELSDKRIRHNSQLGLKSYLERINFFAAKKVF
jgi:hypothetical protein